MLSWCARHGWLRYLSGTQGCSLVGLYCAPAAAGGIGSWYQGCVGLSQPHLVFTEPTGCTIAVCDVGELITSRQRLAGMFCWGSIAVESCVMAVVLVLTWVDGCSCWFSVQLLLMD
jgi:hypothetical protein